ncbi:hypothetical protein QBC45DRAFT_138072 [Copromyces sp. CBS 386.78]|nr:hypothetical protein QBC45DRAFT_138072 [Copromyces sp. CBS 386.78]
MGSTMFTHAIQQTRISEEGNNTSMSLHSRSIWDGYSTRSAGSMAERLTTNQEVPGSTPGWIELYLLLPIPYTERLQ